MLQEQRENRIRIHLLGNEIQNISCYTFEDAYFITADQQTVISNLGIELQVQGLTFNFGWNPELELIDFTNGPLNKDFDVPVHVLDEFSAKLSEAVKGKKITTVNFQWNFYHEADEELNPIGEPNFIPVELLIQLEDESQLQLAAISYSNEDGLVSDLFFDSQEEVLISLNKQLKIDVPE